MHSVTFYGSSDDLVEIGGDAKGADEFNVSPSDRDLGYAGTWMVNGILRVNAFYYGTWYFAPEMIDEDRHIPEGWTLTIRNSEMNAYSLMLEITAEESLTVFKEDRKEMHN